MAEKRGANARSSSFFLAITLVLRQFRFLRNRDSNSLTFLGHFAGIGTGIGAKMNQKEIVF